MENNNTTNMNLSELDLSQLQGIYNDANSTRHLLGKLNMVGCDECYALMAVVDIEGTRRFGIDWDRKK
jgi:hypothetical protein